MTAPGSEERRSERSSHTERHLLVEDDIPALWSIVVPTVFVSMAGPGLFAVGVIQTRKSGAATATSLGSVPRRHRGVIVIGLEVALVHRFVLHLRDRVARLAHVSRQPAKPDLGQRP